MQERLVWVITALSGFILVMAGASALTAWKGM